MMSIESLEGKVQHLDRLINEYPSPVLIGTYQYLVESTMVEIFKELLSILKEKEVDPIWRVYYKDEHDERFYTLIQAKDEEKAEVQFIEMWKNAYVPLEILPHQEGS